MTSFGKRALLWILLGTLLAGLGLILYRVSAAGLERSQRDLQAVQQAEGRLADLRTVVDRWQQSSSEGQTVARVEPVAMLADFSPHEVARMSSLLKGIYGDHGYFNLKSFLYSVVPQTGEGSLAGTNVAQVKIDGEKVFFQ